MKNILCIIVLILLVSGCYMSNPTVQKTVHLGMTKAEVQEAWGDPRRKNTTHTAYAVREQWVYNGRYLYFDNGVLTVVQGSE